MEGRISGLPFPEVKWYKGENLIVPGANPRYTIEGLPDGTQRLIITNAQMSDMDDYRCEATNKYGDVWSDVTLTVQGRGNEIWTNWRRKWEQGQDSLADGSKINF